MPDGSTDPNVPTQEPPKRREHDPAVKAAVMAAMLAGQGIGDVAKTYNLPEGTVKSWASQARRGMKVAGAAANNVEQIGALLIDYVKGNLRTLRAQQKIMSDPEWLKTQNAEDLGVLHGILVDKTVRLLEALGGAGNTVKPEDLPNAPPVAVIAAPKVLV